MTTTTQLRTPDEIVAKLSGADAAKDVLGFTFSVLSEYLPADRLLPLCKPGADLTDWKPEPLDRAAVVEKMRHYMAFAWSKVEDHRGISASRNVEKMAAWMWLLGDDEGVAGMERAPYAQYGAPQLAYVCARYDFPVPASAALARMITGEPCTPSCNNGCGQ